MTQSTSRNPTTPAGRRHDLDALRGIGAALVVVAHCTLVFSPWTSLPVPMPSHKLFSELAWFLNPWLMPLFMLLAGGSAYFALRRRTNAVYLRERAGLLVPLLVGLLAFVIPSLYITRVTAGQFHGSLPAFYLHYLDGIYPAGNFTFLHLWFLAYLLIYALATLPLFRWLQGPRGRSLVSCLADLTGRRGGLLLLALPLLLFQLAVAGRFPMDEYPVVVNDGFRFFTLLYFFICGYLFVSDERFGQAIGRQWGTALALALITSAVQFAIVWPDGFDPRRDLPMHYSWSYAVHQASFILGGWSWLVVLLALGRRFLARPGAVLTYLGRASFVVYLVHPFFWLPGIVIVSRLHLPALAGFLVLTAWDLLTSLGIHEALSRLRSARRPLTPAAALRLGPA